MPFRAWLLIAALGCLSPISGQAQDKTQGAQGAPTDEEQASRPELPPFRIEIVEDQAETEARKRREAESDQREIDDLAAQQGMNAGTVEINEATKDMATYAWYQTLAAWVGTILLIGTLFLAIQANRSNWHAIRISRNIGRTSVRAYLHVESSSVRQDGEGYWFVIVIKNSGQTPAGNVKMATAGGFKPEEYVLHELKTSSPIGPGQTSAIWHGPLKKEIIDEELVPKISSGMPNYLVGRIEFVDAFGRNQWFTYKLAIAGDIYHQPRGFRICDDGNDYSKDDPESPS